MEKKYPRQLFDFEARPLSYSRMKHVLNSPRHFAYEWLEATPKDTDALLLGSLVDVLLLTPDDFEARFKPMPKLDLRTKDGKATKELLSASLEDGQKLVPEDMITKARLMVAAIHAEPKAMRIVNSCTHTQGRLEWRDKKTGLKMKGFRDGKSVIAGRTIQWELKVSRDASNDAFSRQALDLGYPLQAACYTKGYLAMTGDFADFMYVVVENEAPFAVNVFHVDNNFIDYGNWMYRKALDLIKWAYDSDNFDAGYLPEFLESNSLTVPFWAMKQIEE